MKYYIGIKQVLAWPQDKDGLPGYAVKYPDGYTSWSPKEVFEASYVLQGYDPGRIPPEMVDAFIVGHESTRMGNHSVVIAKLRNGFTIVADSACVEPANYDQVLGERYALEKVKRQVWELLGFLLATARNGVDHEGLDVESALSHLESHYGLDDIADAVREALGRPSGDLDEPLLTVLSKVLDDPGVGGLSANTHDCVHFLRSLLKVRK